MGYCPTVNSGLAISSLFAYIMGLEPLQLSAVVRSSSAPSEVYYKGQIAGCPTEGIKLRVTNWKQLNANEYSITAYNDPYFWKLKKITIEQVDVENGVSIDTIVGKIETQLGEEWSIVFEDKDGEEVGEKVGEDGVDAFAFIDFSGSVLHALDSLQQMTGTFAYIDHINKIIHFDNDIPEFEATRDGAYIIERAEGNTVDTEEVVLFGNLNRPSESNKKALSEIGIDGYKDTEIMLDINSWSVDSDVRVDSYTDKLINSGDWTKVDEGEDTTASVYKQIRKETYVRSFEPIITAATNSITQDEVVDYDIDETEEIVTEDGEEIVIKEGESSSKENAEEVDSKYIEFSYEKPTVNAGMDDWAKEIIKYFNSKTFKCAPVTTQGNAQELAQRAVEAIHLDVAGAYTQDSSEEGDNQASAEFNFGKAPKDIVYMFPFRSFSSGSSSRLSFSVSCFLVSAMMTYQKEYNKIYTQSIDSKTGEILDPSVTNSEPPTLDASAGWLAEAFKIALLQYIKVSWTFSDTSMRVKFPYAVDSSGSIYEPGEEFGDNVDEKTLLMQNNYIANMDRAKNYAAIMKKIANMDLEEAWLVNEYDANLLKLSKFSEVFNGGNYKALQYIRKEGDS